MLRTLRAHLSYANVMSTIAVFIVLGGGAYAATKLPKNSVGTKQIKNGAVTKAKLANGVLSAGPKGDTGAQGPKGDKGADGANGTNGTNGTNGKDGTDGHDGARGPSSAQLSASSDVADLDNGSGSTIGSIVLAGGDYVVEAKAVLSSTNAATVDCSVFTSGNAGSPIDSATVKIPAGGQQMVSLLGTTTSGSNFLLFVCDDNGVAGGASALKPKLVATQVDTVS